MPYHDPATMDDPLDSGDDHTAALVRQAVAGDDAAFGRLYDEWFDRVFDAASRVVRDRSAAGDVAQDTFLRAWRSLGSLRDPRCSADGCCASPATPRSTTPRGRRGPVRSTPRAWR